MPEPGDHIPPDDLALLALGEQVDDADSAHLDRCPVCRADVEALTALVASARTVTAEDTPTAPPPRVWDAVRAELASELRPAPEAVPLPAPGPASAAAAATAAASPTPEAAGAEAAGAAADETGGRALVMPLRAAPTRRTSRWLAAAAAVAGLVVGSVATGLIVAANDDGSTGQVVAQTRLAALPAHSGRGAAEVVGTGTNRMLELDVHGLTKGDGFYEVWLLDANGKRLVSLGLLDGSTARFPLPPEVNVDDFPIVDISLEPADGNPAHSGDSIVRGTLAG